MSPNFQSDPATAPGGQALRPTRSAALTLGLAYVVLIVYASLYPFGGWTDLGVPPLGFLTEGWPRYWLASDLIFNVLGYMPLGLLLAVGLQRCARWSLGPALAVVLAASLLSLGMEFLQNYLPQRVSSNLDWALNTLGAALGAGLAEGLRRCGVLALWGRFRQRWFDADARGVLSLMALWPAALLFPAAVPFGVGQVFERLSMTLAGGVQGTAYADWFPLARIDLEPLTRLTQAIGSGLGLLLPMLLGYSIVRSWLQRLVLMPLVVVVGVLVLALSSALSYGPAAFEVWMTRTTLVGIALALMAAVALSGLSRRACLVGLLLATALHLAIVNQAPTSPYLAETLQVWERGQFIHFNGLAQWVGWLWPFATLVYVVRRLGRRP
ncbi:MAG: VanZ family protein [Comamonas sp.]